ncbi:MAG: Na+/H+ antiporter [Mucilaginibacter sp.]
MENFEIVIFIMTVLIVLSVFADKIKLPYPILLVLVGLIIGFAPFLPHLALNPKIVFLIFLPPILYDAAIKTSWLDFKKEIRSIFTLAVTLVFFTTVSVAVAAHYLIPGFSWPLAFVLGAIVSPPDAVAATNITKGLGLSRKVITIIEGESLVNDASALITYRYAIAAVVSGTFLIWKASLEFLLVSAGGILTGLVIGFILVLAHKRIKDNATVETSLTLLTPFVAYLSAERMHSSGVLAVVTAGLLISWRSREIFTYETRLQTKVVWDTLIFLLNGIVFILIGLQLPLIIKNFEKNTLITIMGYGLLISLVTIVIRILWVFAGAYNQGRLLSKKNNSLQENVNDTISWKNVLIVAWTGTRGVVSMATALALPLFLSDGSNFPQRELILFLAFIVILVTLVVQGLTLPLLIKWLNIKPVSQLQKREEKDLQLLITENILQYLNGRFPLELDDSVMQQLKKRYEVNFNLLSHNRNRNRVEKAEKASQLIFKKHMLAGQLDIIGFQRELLLKFQKEGAFNEDAISKAEAELDIEELRLNTLTEKKEEK